MSLPGDLTTTVITATLLDCAGHPVSGSLTVTPSTDVTDATGAVVIPMAERVYAISAQGTITTDPLASTDNETLSPQGWVYLLTLAISGLPPKSWAVQLPFSAEPLDISGVTPVFPVPDVTSYVALTGGDMTGLLTLDGGLKIPAGAVDGDVLTSDAEGNAAWALPTGGSGHHDGGSVTDVSVVTANGFAGTVANEDTTPALTLKTTVTGLLKGNGTGVAAAVSGTDYDAGGAAAAAQTAAEAASVPLAGGTMTGPLALSKVNLDDATSGDLRGSMQSISGDIWILANATWDGTDFHRIDITKAAFGFQQQGQGFIPGEPDLGYFVAGATMWVAQPESYTLIRGGGSSGGNVYGAVGGWELGWTISQQRQLTIGGGGIEIDGYGTYPYTRVVANKTGSVLARHISGMCRNAYTALDGDDTDLQESWFWGYVDQYDAVTPSNNNADGYLTGTNHWSVAYLPAGSISSFSGTFDEYLKVSAAGVVEVSADPTTTNGVATKHYVDTATGALGTVTTVTAGDTSIVVGGTSSAPTIRTATLDVIAADHAPAADWSNNSKKITSLANGSSAQDAAAFGQITAANAAALPLAGGTMTGAIAMGSHKVTGLTAGSASGDAVAFQQTPAGGTTVTVGQGGTGDTTLTAYAPLAGGTTSTGALQQCTTGLSTSGWVLTSNGSSTLPSFQAPSGGSGATSVLTASYATVTHVLDASAHGAFLLTISGSPTTLSFTGSVSGTELSCTVYLIQGSGGSHTVTWTGVKWQDAVPPALSTGAGAVDILVFTSPDGSTWYGSLAAVNMS